MIKLLRTYQKLIWYFTGFTAEIYKPMALANTTGIVFILLAQYDIRLTLIIIVFIYGGILIIGTILGWFFIKIGIAKYNNRLNAEQTPQIVEMLERLDRIEKKVND